MIIIGLVDIHNITHPLAEIGEELGKANIILLGGDITQFGSYNDAGRVISEIQRYNSRILAVTGNCDGPVVSEFLSDAEINLEDNCVFMGGAAFVGISPAFAAIHPQNSDEIDEKIGFITGKIPNGTPIIVVSHFPPFGTNLDIAASGAHTGSYSVSSLIQRHQPILALCGHLHEAAGLGKIGKTVIANPGPLKWGNYLYAEINGREAGKIEIRKIDC